MSTHKIISVCIVEGKTLTSYWEDNMQRIETDKGNFIDNMPEKQFGYSSAHPGFDWAAHVGETVHEIKEIEYDGHRWLNKA